VSLPSLLAPPTNENLPAWEFDHAQAHRELLGAMATLVPDITGDEFFRGTGGLSGFSAIPYFVDPQRNTGAWHLDHGQAHKDFQVTLPRYFGSTTVGFINPTSTDFVDMDFEQQEMLAWWTFANYQQHLIAAGVLPQTLTFPFW